MPATKAQARTERPERQLVRATYAMDTELFVKHFNLRHEDSLAQMVGLPENIAYDVEMAYRAFHARLHETRPRADYEHEHSADPPEAAIEWALFCLSRNRARGWHEIAGSEIQGVVSYFPDTEQWATRIDGVIEHHDDIQDAADRLLHGDE